ncbi:hypothetical protein NLJ89_g6052 [Agrocybe chaxingu]|uniref:Uncharacterized protein n=1 Tax=Agrocybe chaxingu TaxID=84603 RepID=A0A9W8K022_9AGAR|nr:hypothetical protein NLJ89_g6052 [Agrocybe chaxingu]
MAIPPVELPHPDSFYEALDAREPAAIRAVHSFRLRYIELQLYVQVLGAGPATYAHYLQQATESMLRIPDLVISHGSLLGDMWTFMATLWLPFFDPEVMPDAPDIARRFLDLVTTEGHVKYPAAIRARADPPFGDLNTLRQSVPEQAFYRFLVLKTKEINNLFALEYAHYGTEGIMAN